MIELLKSTLAGKLGWRLHLSSSAHSDTDKLNSRHIENFVFEDYYEDTATHTKHHNGSHHSGAFVRWCQYHVCPRDQRRLVPSVDAYFGHPKLVFSQPIFASTI